MSVEIFLKEQWNSRLKNMKEHKEIIASEEMHGFVFNMRGIFFDRLACEQMLGASLETDTHAKRELTHALYMSYFIDNMHMQGKHNYGNCDVGIDPDMVQVKPYHAALVSKLHDQINQEEFSRYIQIIEDVLNLDLQERHDARNLVVIPMLDELGMNQDLSLYFPKMAEEAQEIEAFQAKREALKKLRS
jgi:hypothetical protein